MFAHMLVDLTDFLAFFSRLRMRVSGGYDGKRQNYSMLKINVWMRCLYLIIYEIMRVDERYELVSIETDDIFIAIDIR